VARHAYKSEKRRKETARLKKQEEKRQRRFGAKAREDMTEAELAEADAAGPEEGAAGAPEGVEGKDESAREGTEHPIS
jgi:hypothetical protein